MLRNKEITDNTIQTKTPIQGGLRRQPTKYPHGLGISVHTIGEDRLNYSRSSTLRSSQKQPHSILMSANEAPRLSIIGNSEHLKELQVRRFKYPFKGSYYLDTQEAHKSVSPFELLTNIKLRCNRRHFRWILICLACILLCFGLISYCLWLHNISLAREQFKLRHQKELVANDGIPFLYDNSLEHIETSSRNWQDFDEDFQEPDFTEPAISHNTQRSYASSTMDNFLPETKRAYNIPKVSPTIPPIPKSKPTSMQNLTRTTSLDTRCFSTSLEMCQGVMDYDLTYNSTINLQPHELESYNHLINSNCSPRAVEFICVALQPECRPSHVGALPPCRRVCKAILEACSIIVANYDPLISLFDCSLYPDSIDPQKCEDTTRRQPHCYDNEFECSDNSCIPRQWQCDNIKDCAQEEDETSCLICENQDEFRCHSNDKCIPESARCDQTEDCFDGSDEYNCEEVGSGEESVLDEVSLNSYARIFSFASFLLPNETDEGPLTYVTTNEQESNQNLSSAASVSTSAENPLKGFANFRDSKEIMITSDSENKYKYSAAGRSNRTTSKFTVHTTPLQPAASLRVAVSTEPPPPTVCASHELRCISGQCITVEQLCDKKMDCPDGADELMCVYKQRSRSSTTNTPITTPTTTTTTTTSPTIRTTITANTARGTPIRHRGERTPKLTTTSSTTTTIAPTINDKRGIRTTIKRKLKTR